MKDVDEQKGLTGRPLLLQHESMRSPIIAMHGTGQDDDDGILVQGRSCARRRVAGSDIYASGAPGSSPIKFYASCYG